MRIKNWLPDLYSLILTIKQHASLCRIRELKTTFLLLTMTLTLDYISLMKIILKAVWHINWTTVWLSSTFITTLQSKCHEYERMPTFTHHVLMHIVHTKSLLILKTQKTCLKDPYSHLNSYIIRRDHVCFQKDLEISCLELLSHTFLKNTY